MKKLIRLVLPLILCVGFGTMFYMVSSQEAKDYPSIPLNPPRIIFPIVWSILYILIFISIYIFDKVPMAKEENDQGIILYYFDLFFNSLWTLLFFKLKLRIFSSFWLGALLIIVILRLLIIKKKSPISAYLLIPYVLWLSFALYLNIAVIFV
ncbi:MAG: TspO/MBR family protein [Bacilli bacterium]